MMELSFLCEKKILVKLKRKTTFALMCFVMKTSLLFQSTIQIKNLKTRWICYLQLMKTGHIMCISKIDKFMFHKTKKILVKELFTMF